MASPPGLTAAGLPTRAEQSCFPIVGAVLVKTPRLLTLKLFREAQKLRVSAGAAAH